VFGFDQDSIAIDAAIFIFTMKASGGDKDVRNRIFIVDIEVSTAIGIRGVKFLVD
jgi:hypothetical protein